MNSLSASPVEYSSLEADELGNISDDEDFDDDGSEEPQTDTAEAATLRDRFLRPRFSRWLAGTAADQARQELLNEVFEKVVVSSYGAESISSERVFSVDFTIASMEGQYSQRCQADPLSATWDAGTLLLVPNLEATLTVDGETILGCRYFAGAGSQSIPKLETDVSERSASTSSGAGAGKSRRWVNGARLLELFGTETSVKLGGIPMLLQFWGVICADSCAPTAYTEALPFGLSAALVGVSEEKEDATSTTASSQDIRAGYPVAPTAPAAKKSTKSTSRGPAPGALGATATSAARSNPRASSHTRK